MRCKKVRKLILMGRSGEDAVAEHLAGCEECREMLALSVQMKQFWDERHERDLAPEKIVQIRNAAAELMKQRAQVPAKVIMFPRPVLAVAAAAAILLIIAGLWFVGRFNAGKVVVSDGPMVAQAFPMVGLDAQIASLSRQVEYGVGSFGARHSAVVAQQDFDSRMAVLKDRVELCAVDIAREIGSR